jgi:diketogulonate reductase-like aldo/keto reductase
VVPWCAKNNVAVVGYTPFGQAKFLPSGPGGKLLEEIAKKLGATPRQVALAFLTRLPGTFAIPKPCKSHTCATTPQYRHSN